MGRFNYITNNFKLGECSPAMLGSTDLKDQYSQMCQEITNSYVKKQGGTSRRPGTQYVAKTVATIAIPTEARLIPFVFAKTISYQIVVCKDATIGTLGITIVNTSTFAESTITNGLSASPYQTFTGYSVMGTFADLQVSQYSQTGDVLCITNSIHCPIYLIRTGTDAFTLCDIFNLRSTLQSISKPYQIGRSAYGGSNTTILTKLSPSSPPASTASYYSLPYVNDTAMSTITPSAITGNITVTWGGGVNNRYANGTIIRIDSGGVTGFLVLVNTGVIPNTATVLKNLPGTAAYAFQYMMWENKVNMFPRCVGFFQQRHLLASNTSYPDTLWATQQGDIAEFMVLRPTDDANFTSLSNDRPFQFTMAQDEISEIQWLASDKDLFLGTGGKEYICVGPDTTLSIGALNINFIAQTAFGSEYVQAKLSDGTVHFVQRGGVNLREMIYEFRENKRIANDMNKYADHIVKKGLTKRATFAVPKIIQLAYQALEHNITWALDSNNCLYGLTRDRHEEVMGWHWHEIGGVTNSTEISKVVSISCSPSADGDSDELWLLVTRTINSATVTYLEKIGKPYRFTSVSNSSTSIKDKLVMSDSAVLQHLGSPGTAFNGFTHLKNTIVDCFADGFYLGQKTVDNSGTITLDASYTNLVAGIPYNTRIRPNPVPAGAIMGTADSVPKRIDRVIFRFQDTIRALHGKTDDATLIPIEFRDASLANGTPTPMFTGVKLENYKGPVENDADVLIKCDQALPFTLTSLTMRGVTYEG